MKIGFIGCGNMANAIIKSVSESSKINCKDIFVFDINLQNAEKFANNYTVNICKTTEELINCSNIVVLAVKPNIIAAVLSENSDYFEKNNNLIISIAAGKTIEYINSNLKQGNKIVRVMPNINAKVGGAMCAYCHNEYVNDNDKKNVEEIFSPIGKIIKLDESYFSLFGVIAGCSPAFVYMFINAMAETAVKNGMNKKDALQISAQTVLGSAKMILESEEHPWALVDQVCSPAGTTIEGVLSLQKDGFETAIHNAINKAIEKDSKI